MKNKNGFKKQLAGGAVYAALAVTVVAVTVSTITASFSDKASDGGTNTPDTIYKSGTGIKLPSPGTQDFTLDTPVSDTPSGVDATVTPPADDSAVAAAPKQEAAGGEDAQENPETVAPKAEDSAPSGELPSGTEVSPPPEETPATPDKTQPVPEEPQTNEPVVSYSGYIRPCSGYISKEFSIEVPVYSPTMYDYRTHAGVDIACDIGTPVKAATGGVVREIRDDYMMGTTIVIEHADGVCSVYSNLSSDLPSDIEVGKTVATGDIIGGVGDTALCESAEVNHLHFEMTLDGKPVNPEEYLPL